MDLIESASLILYSRQPIEMAKRRGLDESTLELLVEKEAVAEAFGEFINKEVKSFISFQILAYNLLHLKRLSI